MCQVCGRPLRTPESRARRTGPTCWRATHPPVRRTPAPAGNRAVTGQAELPLPPVQTALWSL
jgi:hypothetical protein